MAKYAEGTEVPVERSKAEIEATVMRYGATGFISGWKGTEAMISFELHDRRIRFNLPLPDRNDRAFTHARVNHNSQVTKPRSPDQATRAWEQACRQKWRALALVIKAKLEAVESRISTLEEEFLNNIVMENGMTIGEMVLPRIASVISSGKLPPMLPGPGQEGTGG